MGDEQTNRDAIETAPQPVAVVGPSKKKRKPAWSVSALIGEIGAGSVCLATAYWGLRTAVLVFCCWAVASVAIWIACRRWRLRQVVETAQLPSQALETVIQTRALPDRV
jgi:hypothetical protein